MPQTSAMLALLLAVSALATGARADCNACVENRCHYRKPILSGFSVAHQMVIDKENNILYLQLNGQNVAIFLDDLQHRLVNTKSTTAMAFDQTTQTLYLAAEGAIYKHNLVSNTTTYVKKINNDIPAMKILEDKLVYFETYPNNTSAFYVSRVNSPSDYEIFSVNYIIKDFIIDDGKYIYFVSNDTLYLCVNKVYYGNLPAEPKPLLSKKKILIHSRNYNYDIADWLYIGSPTERVIYKLNKSTQELTIYAGYTGYASSVMEDFVIGKNGVIVSRDSDGSIDQWLPINDHARCLVEPPHDNYFVRQMSGF